jgi:hypothetical protein
VPDILNAVERVYRENQDYKKSVENDVKHT